MHTLRFPKIALLQADFKVALSAIKGITRVLT
jgi:hypothetical protein